MRGLINKLFLLFVLADNLYVPVEVGFDFRVTYIIYAMYILYYAICFRRIRVNPGLLFVISAILFLFWITIMLNREASILLYFKQLVFFFLTFLACYMFLASYGFNYIKAFKDYIAVIYISAIVGVIQFLSFKLGFKFGADYSYLGFDMGNLTFRPEYFRVQSWFREPSFLVYAYTPVIFVGLGRLFGLTKLISIKRALVILLVMLLSTSSLGYLSLIFSLLIIGFSVFNFIKKPLFLFPMIIATIVASILIYQIPMVKFRVDDTLSLYFDEDITEKDINKTNLSTYALYSNYKITKAAAKDYPIFGFGWGNYEIIYDKYLDQEVPYNSFYNEKLNRKDASSLLLRITAELGLVFLVVFVYLLLKYRLRIGEIDRKNCFQMNSWLINNGIFVLILLRCIRQGNYFMLGLCFFLIIYVLSKKRNYWQPKHTVEGIERKPEGE